MIGIAKTVKMLYCQGDKMTISELRQFTNALDCADGSDELEVHIEEHGDAFTIEGYIEEA